MSQGFYFDEYQRNQAEGLRAYRRGRIPDARYHFLKAADYLFRLARESDGRLREVRFEKARRLVAYAKKLKEAPRRQPVAARETEQGQPPEPEKASSWLVRERPDVRFADIAGLEDAKERIRVKMIYPFTHPEKAGRYGIRSGGGILLYGPPGTGKTMLGRAVAAELECPFYLIRPSDILSKWVGESEQNIARLFDEARSHDKAVIFLDEVEALVPARREQQSNVMQRVVPQILAELDGFEQHRGCLLFLGATNEPWSIDYAMLRPGRLDEKVYVGLPNVEARRAILASNLRGAPLSDRVDLDILAEQLDGYSGADIAYLCRRVREDVFRESVERGTDREVEPADFDAVMARMNPSVGPEQLGRFDAFRREVEKR